MGQPQSGCVNLQHAGYKMLHTEHHRLLRSYHSHHSLQKNKLGVEHFLLKLGYCYSSALKTSQDFIDHIYKISMKILLD
jgi:hypothetical protein